MIRDFFNTNNFEYLHDESLKKYNTYKVDIKAKYIVFPENVSQLKIIIEYLKEKKIKYMILGNGSNVIFAIDYYDGVIIKLDKLNNLNINKNIVEVEAGYSLIKLSMETINNGLSGLEFACGIPGTVGASVAMNAGAYNEDMSTIVKEVIVLDENGNIKKLNNKELNYTYRNSVLKEHPKYIVLKAIIELAYKDKEEMLKLVQERRKRRIDTQPLEYPSAGSVFRNPQGNYAGHLIEECNLKGYNLNGAEVSQKHANFIINKDNAKGTDIEKLIKYIQKEVFKKFNINLILEQIIVK